MKRKKHTDEQILTKLRRVEELLAGGMTAKEAIKDIEVSAVTYYRWKKQFGGVNKDEVRRLKKLERENERLKKMVAEKELDIAMMKEVIEGKYQRSIASETRRGGSWKSSRYPSVAPARWWARVEQPNVESQRCHLQVTRP